MKQAARSLFYSDVVADDKPSKRSVIEFEADNFLAAAESFTSKASNARRDSSVTTRRNWCWWRRSRIAIWTGWLPSTTRPSASSTRRWSSACWKRGIIVFACGCNQERMLTMLAPIMRSEPDSLFEGEETIRISCPRCGARHTITREALEARIAAEKKAQFFFVAQQEAGAGVALALQQEVPDGAAQAFFWRWSNNRTAQDWSQQGGRGRISLCAHL